MHPRAALRLLRQMATYSALMLAGVMVPLIILESGLRISYVWPALTTPSLKEQLERSRQSQPVVATGSVTVRGLIEPSLWPDVVYQLKPNLSGTFQSQPFSFNSFGMRDREYSLQKPGNTFRIAGLGDSVMFGWGVGQEQAYLKLVEQDLNAQPNHQMKYEVLNFGVPGYNTSMEVGLFEHLGINFDPDLVILHFVNNDFGVPLFMQKPKSPFSLSRLYALEFISEHWRTWHRRDEASAGPQLTNLEGYDAQDKNQVLQEYRYMVGPKGCNRALARLAALTQPRNIRVLVLASSATGRQAHVLEKACARWGFELFFLGPYVDAFVHEHNIPDTPRARQKALILSKKDQHPNALGHQVYKEAIWDRLRPILGLKHGIVGPVGAD